MKEDDDDSYDDSYDDSDDDDADEDEDDDGDDGNGVASWGHTMMAHLESSELRKAEEAMRRARR